MRARSAPRQNRTMNDPILMSRTATIAIDRNAQIEDRIFRRGVSDQDVRTAVELIREYVSNRLDSEADEHAWWMAFGEIFEDLSRNFTPAQLAAFEIATDTILVGYGCPSWTRSRAGLSTRVSDAPGCEAA